MDSLMAQYYSQLEEERREMRVLVEGVMEGHQSSKEAKQRIQETKHAIGEDVLLVEVSSLRGRVYDEWEG